MARAVVPPRNSTSTKKSIHKKRSATSGGKKISKSNSNSRYGNRGRDATSRPMTRLRRSTFPFLQLPGELRNMIYRRALNFSGLEQIITDSFSPFSDDLTLLPKKTPALLLLNRQSHVEAKGVLYRENVLTIEEFPISDDREESDNASTVKYFVSKGVIAQIQHVVFRRVDRQSVSSWMATLHDLDSLIKYFVSVWTSEGCSLKTLRIEVGHYELQEHIDVCIRHGGICHAQVFLDSILVSLKSLQYLKLVEFKGPISRMHNANDVKRWMTTPKPLFLQLPASVRNLIYGYVLEEIIASRQRDDYQIMVVGHSKDLVVRSKSGHGPISAPEDIKSKSKESLTSLTNGETVANITSPPHILLVNKQTSHEVKVYLQNVPMVFKKPLDLFVVSSKQELRHSEIRVSLHQSWQDTIRKLTNIVLEIDVSHGTPQKWRRALRSFGTFCCEYHIEAPAVRLIHNKSIESATYTRRMTGIAEVLEQELKQKLDKIIYLDEFTDSEVHRFAANGQNSQATKRSARKCSSARPSLGGLQLPGSSSASDAGSNS